METRAVHDVCESGGLLVGGIQSVRWMNCIGQLGRSLIAGGDRICGAAALNPGIVLAGMELIGLRTQSKRRSKKNKLAVNSDLNEA